MCDRVEVVPVTGNGTVSILTRSTISGPHGNQAKDDCNSFGRMTDFDDDQKSKERKLGSLFVAVVMLDTLVRLRIIISKYQATVGMRE